MVNRLQYLKSIIDTELADKAYKKAVEHAKHPTPSNELIFICLIALLKEEINNLKGNKND